MLSEEGQAAVRAAARDVMADVDAIAHDLERFVFARLGDPEVDEDLRASFIASCLANITLLAGMLGSGSDPARTPIAPEAERFVVDLARVSDPALDLMRIYRLSQAELWAQWQKRLRAHTRDADTLDETTSESSSVFFTMTDVVLVALRERHDAEVERLASRVETMRADAVRELLEADDPDVRGAGARLRYPIDRWHVGVSVCVPEGAAPDPAAVLDAAVGAVSAVLGHEPLVMTAAGDVVHAWVGAGADPGTVAIAPVPGALIAFGRPAHGVDGFRSTRAEAVRTLELARALGHPPGSVVRFDDVEVLALLGADREAARRYAAGVLAPVFAEGTVGDGLIETLAALHDADLNPRVAAERLHVHRNTVSYRVRRFLDLTGESDPGSLRVRAAIALAPLAARSDG